MEDKGYPIKFEVFREGMRLKLAKPHPPGKHEQCPVVSIQAMSSQNLHALKIMYLNHKNIVSLKAIGKLEMQEGHQISAFIGGCAKPIYDAHFWNKFVMGYNRIIPSTPFQSILSETFDGVDFLWRNRTYHGNLGWPAILYDQSSETVTLNDFEYKEIEEESLETAQWGDWDSIIDMLQVVADDAARLNGTPQFVYFDELSEFILRMNGLPRLNILSMRDTVLRDVFFWTPSERTRFVMIKVQEFLNDAKFAREVEKSDICNSNWDSPEARLAELNSSFNAVVKQCNAFRDTINSVERRSDDTAIRNFDGTKKMDCVRLAYAAYTHQEQMHVTHSIDVIFRAKLPKFFVGLNRIITSLETSVGAGTSGGS